MVHRVAGLVLVVCLLGVVLAGASPALLGSAFADSYTAFAPLYAVYRSYANYLVYGSEVAIPPGLNEACENVSDRLVDLHMAFIVQTDSQRVEEVTRLAHLRSSVASFCRDYQEQIAAIGNFSEPTLDLSTQAADVGMFAAVYELNKQLEGAFTIALEGYEGTQEGWAFSVSFRLAHLRSSEASFCPDYQEQIAAIGNLSEPALDLFTQAADAGMFATVYELNKQLEGVFTITLESYEGTQEGWAFSVSFAIRALLNQGPIEQVDPTLKEILLGPEEEPFPRKDLPAEILEEIDAFATLIGRSLTADEQEEMASLALTIYTFLNS